jgi:hypothetical protein
MDGAVRAAFYTIVQVGGFIELESELGEALSQVLGDRVRSRDRKETGTKVFFAGDLYEWLVAERSNLPTYPLFEDWHSREYARTVVIPLYKDMKERAESS